MIALDDSCSPAVSVPADAKWPWLVLAAGAVLVVAGGFAFSPAEPAPGPVVDQPASLAVPAEP